MGVPGLWDVLNKAGKSTSLAHLAVANGFEQNASGRRAYRIGIDTSIWLHHANWSKGGDSPEVRNLFFRLCFLKKLPITPIFMFDGRLRPKVKRGSKLGKSGSHEHARHFKKFIEAFGMEWREAAAEAEAELAYLNKEGYIDAIMTDDCDAFLFGAKRIIKNLSTNLSGNKNNKALNEDNKADKFHAMVYEMDDLKKHPEISLTRGGMILFALVCGGDYDKGLKNFGPVIGHALARSQFGDDLLEAAQNLPRELLPEFLLSWRTRLNNQLRLNSLGLLRHRTSLSIPDTFPDLEVLDRYVRPVVNDAGMQASGVVRDNREMDIAKIGQLCEEYFEWGYREKILERFKGLVWPGAVMHVLRRAALEGDRTLGGGGKEVGTPARIVQGYLVDKTKGTGKATRSEREERIAGAFVRRDDVPAPAPSRTSTSTSAPRLPDIPDPNPLIGDTIHRERRHASMDKMLEYYVEVLPVQLVGMVGAGLKGTRAGASGGGGASANGSGNGNGKEKGKDPMASFKMWVPAVMLDVVHPSMVRRFKDKQKQKGQGQGKKGGRGTKRARAEVEEDDELGDDYDDDEIEFVDLPPSSQATTSTVTLVDVDMSFPGPSSQSRSASTSTSRTANLEPTNKAIGAVRGFAFAFQDPTFDEFLMDDFEEHPVADTNTSFSASSSSGRSSLPVVHAQGHPTGRTEVGPPVLVASNRVERIVDQILDNPSKRRKTGSGAVKAKANSGVNVDPNATMAVTQRKQRRPSKNLKKAKIIQGAGAGQNLLALLDSAMEWD